jgi:hypothetical protein
MCKPTICLFSAAVKLHVHMYWNNWSSHPFLREVTRFLKSKKELVRMKKKKKQEYIAGWVGKTFHK